MENRVDSICALLHEDRLILSTCKDPFLKLCLEISNCVDEEEEEAEEVSSMNGMHEHRPSLPTLVVPFIRTKDPD